MFVSLHDLEVKTVDIAENFAPGKIDFGEDTTQSGDLRVTGRAELIEENHGGRNMVRDIRLVGHFAGKFESACSRCLEPVTTELKQDFDLLYRPLRAGKQGEEVSISEAETEIGFYQGEGLDTADAVKEQVLLAMPAKPLCKEECKGLCPSCGQNLNMDKCSCAEQRQDGRWSALESIRGQLKKR